MGNSSGADGSIPHPPHWRHSISRTVRAPSGNKPEPRGGPDFFPPGSCHSGQGGSGITFGFGLRRLAGRSKVECARLRIAGVLALAVVEGRAVGRVNPGDPGEVEDAGVAGDGFGAPQGDQRRVGDKLAVRAVRRAGIDLLGAGAEGLAAAQLTQCRAVRASFASAQVKMKLDGRVCRWPEQSTTTVLRWAAAGAAARADAGVAAPLLADAQPATRPRASRVAARAAAVRLGEGFTVPPRNAHSHCKTRRGGNGWVATGRGGGGALGGAGVKVVPCDCDDAAA